ncbi:MAG: right-handed parallel beta-helix repeat-containing protein, partial [Planctomycetota bacterium]
SGSNPTISYCVISDCTVIGGVGGNGADGNDFNDPCNPENDATNGWPGGHGSGNGYGGAIYVGSSGNASIYGCTIINNTAGGGLGGDGGDGGPGSDSARAGSGGDGGNGEGYGKGAGIYCKRGRIENCIIENNRTYGGIGGKGGAIGSVGTLEEDEERVIWPGNDGGQTGVGNGGGVCTPTVSDPCIIDCNFIGNHAKGRSGLWEFPAGGAIYVDLYSTIYLTRCSFEENYIGDTYEELESGEIDYWQASGAGNGGALYCDADDLFITDSVFVRNNNHKSSSYFKINELEFLYPNDEEGSAGGAIYLGEHTAATITGSVISGNSAYRNGGGIYFEGTLDIRSSSISGNESAKGNGGGLYCDDPDGPLTITQSTFGQNTAALIGGGVYCMDFDAQLSNSYFIENQAHQAGGLYLINGAGTVDINDCVISENIATGGAAGGMWSLNTPGTVRNCIFSGNKVTSMAGSGGALSIYSESPEVFNCLFTGNSAPNKGGGVMCAIYAYPFIANCTFADNHVDDYGGGVYCDATSGVEIINSIFANCNNKAIYEQNGAISGVTVTYSHFWNEPTRFYGKDFYLYNVSYESNNVFDSSQRFAGAFLRDYYLMAGGPAIDYGYRTASYWGLDTRTTQVSGALDSSTVDLGYHYTAKPPQYPLEVELIGPGIIEVSPEPAMNPLPNELLL